jgi:hypothetical protein
LKQRFTVSFRLREQETHPSVQNFLQTHARPELLQPVRKRKSPENDLDTENDEDEDKEQETATADAARKRSRGKQAANVKTGGRSEARKAEQIPSQSPAHRARRVHAPRPSSSPDLSPVPVAGSPAVARGGMAPVDALRDSRRTLRAVVQDPLEEVRREAAAAAPAVAAHSTQPDKISAAKNGRRAKSLFLDPTDQGRKCEVCCRL